jgi:hypothetical protein
MKVWTIVPDQSALKAGAGIFRSDGAVYGAEGS